jgi:hypothetical protein
MYTYFKSEFQFSYKTVLIISVVLLLLFSVANIIMAAPFMDEPDKAGMFLTYDAISDGSNKDQNINSYYGLDFGVIFPVSYGSIGLKTSVNNNSNYSYYEIFSIWQAMHDNLMELTMEHLNDDGNVLRCGFFRSLQSANENFKAYFGPGLSFFISDENKSFSLFLQTKIDCRISEGIYIYGAGLYDFNLSNNHIEFGMEFAY